jgi:hypothetical protein
MERPTLLEAALIAAAAVGTAWAVKKIPVAGTMLVVPAVGVVAYTAALNRPSGGYQLVRAGEKQLGRLTGK